MIAAQPVDPSVSRTPLPFDAADLPTICVLCSQNCGVRVDVAGGRIVAVRADERNPITTGYICNKGFSIPSYVRHAERLAHPLIPRVATRRRAGRRPLEDRSIRIVRVSHVIYPPRLDSVPI